MGQILPELSMVLVISKGTMNSKLSISLDTLDTYSVMQGKFMAYQKGSLADGMNKIKSTLLPTVRVLKLSVIYNISSLSITSR